jgi:hypothetical protein
MTNVSEIRVTLERDIYAGPRVCGAAYHGARLVAGLFITVTGNQAVIDVRDDSVEKDSRLLGRITLDIIDREAGSWRITSHRCGLKSAVRLVVKKPTFTYADQGRVDRILTGLPAIFAPTVIA